ncbi:hypothetical protein B0H19DRAFT_1109284 [Mycena capillaripes]|nr:hypothetical protein B0H19DRAFT_1109284 [Mycena capillaripes]
MLLASRRLALPLFRASIRACSTGKSDGPNYAILEMLKTNKEEEAQRSDKNPYKIRAFTSAIRVIGQLDHPIRSAAEAKALKGVGAGIFRRIQDFLQAPGNAPDEVDPEALSHLKEDRLARAELEQISGIGPIKARQLVAAGCRTLEQLRTTPEYLAMLSNPQRVGATYFHHIEERVSRVEAETVAVSTVPGGRASELIITAMRTGRLIPEVRSYYWGKLVSSSTHLTRVSFYLILSRRGAPNSSDIDLLILHPDHVHVPFPTVLPGNIKPPPGTRKRKGGTRPPPSLLQLDVIAILESRGIIAATLSSGELKWQGMVLLPDPDAAIKDDQLAERKRRMDAIDNGEGVYRRMDISLVAQKSRGAALVSLTGDTDFICDTRIRAHKVGMLLNEYGLWRWNENEEEPHEGFWELVRAETEEEVLREVGMEYVEPTKRNFAALGKVVTGKATGKKRL